MISPLDQDSCRQDGNFLDDDEVPPLEDMSHLKRESATDRRPITTAKQQKDLNLNIYKNEKEFSGLQKGFFTSKPRPKPSTSTVKSTDANLEGPDNIPFIRASSDHHKNPLEFSEIKDAIASQFDRTRNEWMTPEFMEKIEKSHILSKAFQDDRFLAIAQDLARDPMATIQKVSREMPQFIPALQEFTALIGEAMEEKANAEERKKQPKLDDFEQGLVDKAMKDEKVQNALKDPVIQNLLLQLRSSSDPNHSISRIMQTSPPDTRMKIQVLIECGLLSVV